MSEQANEMTCAELANVAAELALGVLTGRERAEAVAHLDWCEDCREDVRQLMATGEGLLALLPEREPPAGFETRVLDRLGFGSAGGQVGSGAGVAGSGTGVAGAGGAAGGVGARTRRHVRRRTGERGPGDRRPAPRRRRGRWPGDGLLSGARRLLAAAAVLAAIVGAGLGGWGLGHSGGVAPAASAQLASASFVSVAGSSAGQTVGKVFAYQGNPRWLYMWVEMAPSNSAVTCQVVGTDGRVTTIGSFQLADGYGAWGSPDPGYLGQLRDARLVTANGTVLATATFPSQ